MRRAADSKAGKRANACAEERTAAGVRHLLFACIGVGRGAGAEVGCSNCKKQEFLDHGQNGLRSKLTRANIKEYGNKMKSIVSI
jgi:hypothetical protein